MTETPTPSSGPDAPRPRGRRQPVYEFENDYLDPDENYVPIRVDSPVGRRVVSGVVSVVLALSIVAGLVVVWSMRQLDPPGDTGPAIALVVIPRGATLSSIARILEKQRVISSASVFNWYAKIRGVGSVRAGDYVKFRENMSMSEAASVLKLGPVPPQSTALTVVPGLRLADVLPQITKAFPAISVDALKAELASGAVASKYLPANSKNYEGLLAPDTYEFPKKATAHLILQTLASQQVKVLDKLGYGRAEALAGRSAYDLITIASLIEKEAGDPPEEKPKIARVINNRLDSNTGLFIDASVLYGLDRRNGGLTKDDLAKDTPYNNRLHTGLPPTPISMPGAASLAAAIQPAEGDWVYYVLISKNPSAHFFTSSFAEFNAKKAESQAKGIF